MTTAPLRIVTWTYPYLPCPGCGSHTRVTHQSADGLGLRREHHCDHCERRGLVSRQHWATGGASLAVPAYCAWWRVRLAMWVLSGGWR